MTADQLLGSILTRLDAIDVNLTKMSGILGRLEGTSHSPATCNLAQDVDNLKENQAKAKGAMHLLLAGLAVLTGLLTAGFTVLARILK